MKDVRNRGGRGVNQKRTLADTGPEGVRGKVQTSTSMAIFRQKTTFSPDLA